MIQEMLERFGLQDVDYEDLNAAEKESFNGMLQAAASSELSPEKVKDYIVSLREGVSRELSEHLVDGSLSSKLKDSNLKARLRNYTLLEAFLTSPDRAKKALEESIRRSGLSKTA